MNLGTPDATDYWSMRRYLSEFLSDKRVIDYPSWLWQPLLQLVILSKRPASKGRDYDTIWNKELDESPLKTVTRSQAEKLADPAAAAFAPADGRLGDALRQPQRAVASNTNRASNVNNNKKKGFPSAPSVGRFNISFTTASAPG